MSYNINTWNPGDKITSQKLNNIEQGIYDNDNNISNLQQSISDFTKIRYVNILNTQEQNSNNIKVLEKEWIEIKEYLTNNQVVIAIEKSDTKIQQYLIQTISSENNLYTVIVNNITYIAATENGYPTYHIN